MMISTLGCMDAEHKIIFEELAAMRASILQNTKLLQMLVRSSDPNKTLDDLTNLYESDTTAFLKSIPDRLKKASS